MSRGLCAHALLLAGAIVACAHTTTPVQADAAPTSSNAPNLIAIDAELVRSLPGFHSAVATVNGMRLHYVEGGTGPTLVLLPGWPQTWWEFHKMMPALAQHHRVVAVDLRGMGQSDRPPTGYDKKTMAADIAALVMTLGASPVDVVGHDIGSMVAFSLAATHPEVVRRVVLIDVPPPDRALLSWPLLPAKGTFSDKLDPAHPYVWWFAFHQVPGLPEKLLAGRIRIEQDWAFHYLTIDDSAISAQDRDVYAAAYDSADAIRAGNAWYQAFMQDVDDNESYPKLRMPVLGLGGPGYAWLSAVLPAKAENARVVKVENSGHFVPEEQPELTTKAIESFLAER